MSNSVTFGSRYGTKITIREVKGGGGYQIEVDDFRDNQPNVIASKYISQEEADQIIDVLTSGDDDE